MKHWWDDVEPIHKNEDDGQSLTWVYTRQYRNQWQYAIVTLADDGTFIRAMVLSNGNLREIESEENGA